MRVYTVEDLINDLKEFNPKAKVMNIINISWASEDENGDITKLNADKLSTDKIWIFDETYNSEVFEE